MWWYLDVGLLWRNQVIARSRHEWDECLYKKEQTQSLSWTLKIKQEDIHLQNTKRILTKIKLYGHLDLGFPTFRTVRNNFYCFSHPIYSICYSTSSWLEQYPLSSFTCTTKAAFLHIPSNIQLRQSFDLIKTYNVLILPLIFSPFIFSLHLKYS